MRSADIPSLSAAIALRNGAVIGAAGARSSNSNSGWRLFSCMAGRKAWGDSILSALSVSVSLDSLMLLLSLTALVSLLREVFRRRRRPPRRPRRRRLLPSLFAVPS